MALTPISTIYMTQALLITLTGAFLLWRTRQADQNETLLWTSGLSFLITALLLLAFWVEVSTLPPWQYYARFVTMPLVALLGLPLFSMLFHLPDWDHRARHEYRWAIAFLSLRLIFEGVWLGWRSFVLFSQDLVLARPFFADLLFIAAFGWLISLIIRRIQRLQYRTGHFITEAILLGLAAVPPTLAQIGMSMGLIDRVVLELVRDLMILVITPLMVLAFLDLLPESIPLLARLIGLTLTLSLIAINAAALLIAPFLPDPVALHAAMLRLTLLSLVTTGLVLLAVPLLLKRSVFRPLEGILRGVRQMDAGDLEVEVPVSVRDEIGMLALSFNRMVGVVRSTVTELEARVQARTADLALSEARYRDLIEQIDDVIVRIALPAGQVEYVSPAIERLLGYPATSLITAGPFLAAHMAPDETGPAAERFAALVAGAVIPVERYRVVDHTGRERWIEQFNTPIIAHGQLVAVESICRDITAVRLQEAQLLDQQRELATLRERERIGRDLHDGIGQVMGYVNLQAQSADQLVASGQIDQARTLLSRLIQIAQTTHADLRRFILELRLPALIKPDLPWSVALNQALGNFQQVYGIEVQLSCPPSMPTDPLPPSIGREVLQIILEALNNVQKHAEVTVAQVVLQHTPNMLTVIVADQGIGFVPGDAERVRSGRDQASGFGLRIMAERAATIGATLHLDSAPGAGTQVVLHLPYQFQILVPAAKPAFYEALNDVRILLVDDHPLFREGMQNLLATRGLTVVGVAEDGIEAQVLARQLQPDVILMDMQMPRCGGIEATAAIKLALPATRIIMLTVSAEEEHLFQALQAGASGYLLKNLDSEAFFRLLNDALNGEMVLSQGLAVQSLELFMTELSTALPADGATLPTLDRLLALSPRQRDVLERTARGQTYKEIATQLMLTEATVKYHMGQIVGLLQVANRREALALLRKGTKAP